MQLPSGAICCGTPRYMFRNSIDQRIYRTTNRRVHITNRRYHTTNSPIPIADTPYVTRAYVTGLYRRV